jgi:uncharacterized lipoprotein
MRMTPLIAGACLAVLALGQGCALTTDTIRIGYGMTKPGRITGAEGVTVTVNVKDLRGMGDRVSVKKNGYGMEMAPIIDPQAISTLKGAIEGELRARGFAPGAGATVDIEVVRFYNDFKMGFFAGDAIADMSLNVQVKGPDQAILYVRSIQAEGANKGVLLAGGEEAKVALEEALRVGVNKLLTDRTFFDALLKTGQHPPAAVSGTM